MRRILSVALLLLFACYYASATLFVHSHLIDGVQVVHSHFSFGEDSSTHSHTKAEVQLIATLSSFVMVIVAAITLRPTDRKLLCVIVLPESLCKDLSDYHRTISLRAPPVATIAA